MTALRLLPELEDSLRAIPGVRAASVVTTADAYPTEIHVLADHRKAPKQLVRDIQSLASASYGLDIDHRIVSIVQIDGTDGMASAGTASDSNGANGDGHPPGSIPGSIPGPAYGGELVGHASTVNGTHAVSVSQDVALAEPPARVHIDTLSVTRERGETEVGVAISFGDDAFRGTARGPAGPATLPRLAARATLGALDGLLGVPAELDHAAVLPVGGYAMALCVIQVYLPGSGAHALSGSAIVRGDETEAMVRAVLDALNRRLG